MANPRGPWETYGLGTWIESEERAGEDSEGFGRRAQVLLLEKKTQVVRCESGNPDALGGIAAYYDKGGQRHRGVIVTEPVHSSREWFLRFYEDSIPRGL